jgi:hypothetical protein
MLKEFYQLYRRVFYKDRQCTAFIIGNSVSRDVTVTTVREDDGCGIQRV